MPQTKGILERVFKLSEKGTTVKTEILAGLTVSPTFATGNLIVKDLVPAESLTEGLSWVTTAGTVGTSIGSSVAGIVLDASNPHVGMMLPFIFTLASVPLALAGWALAKRRG